MKTSPELPPNFSLIQSLLKVTPDSPMYYTYGDTIYHVVHPLAEHSIAHEEVHQKQQGDDPDGWWTRYLIDSDFRLQEELEGYAAQYRSAVKIIGAMRGAPPVLEKFLDQLASALSGPEYGSILTFGQARSKIKNKAK